MERVIFKLGNNFLTIVQLTYKGIHVVSYILSLIIKQKFYLIT